MSGVATQRSSSPMWNIFLGLLRHFCPRNPKNCYFRLCFSRGSVPGIGMLTRSHTVSEGKDTMENNEAPLVVPPLDNDISPGLFGHALWRWNDGDVGYDGWTRRSNAGVRKSRRGSCGWWSKRCRQWRKRVTNSRHGWLKNEQRIQALRFWGRQDGIWRSCRVKCFRSCCFTWMWSIFVDCVGKSGNR